MYKKAIVDDLQVKILDYEKLVKAGSIQEKLKQIKLKTNHNTTDIFKLPSKIHFLKFINFSTVCEGQINNFKCEFYNDSLQSLSIQCRKAEVSYKSSNIELRGHVIIKNGESTLETNFAQWDFEKNIFNVKNTYVLNRNGTIVTGQNGTFNSQLQEENKCTAKLE
jgi:hypothetical protein